MCKNGFWVKSLWVKGIWVKSLCNKSFWVKSVWVKSIWVKSMCKKSFWVKSLWVKSIWVKSMCKKSFLVKSLWVKICGWKVFVRRVSGWRVSGWKVYGWKVCARRVSGWKVCAIRVSGWRVSGWKVYGWKVCARRVSGWRVSGWKKLGNIGIDGVLAFVPHFSGIYIYWTFDCLCRFAMRAKIGPNRHEHIFRSVTIWDVVCRMRMFTIAVLSWHFSTVHSRCYVFPLAIWVRDISRIDKQQASTRNGLESPRELVAWNLVHSDVFPNSEGTNKRLMHMLNAIIRM